MADAVFYLKKAVEFSSDTAYSIELAKTLSLVSQFEQSNLIYLKLLASGKSADKCCYGLSQNLYLQSDMEHSMYYLNIYMDKYSSVFENNDPDDDEYFEVIDDEEYGDYQIVYPFEKRDMSDVINRSRNLMKQGMFESAIKLLKKIPEGNYDYVYAQNNIALCCFFLNDFAGTKKYSDNVLKKEKDNVFALCNLAAMYNFIDDTKESSAYLKRVLELNITDISDLFKVATTLCELKEHEAALKYLKMILTQKPYDANIMFLTAIAYYNNRNVDAAIDMLLKLNKFNEKDYVVKYYLKLIRNAAKEGDDGFFQPLEYICQLPYGEMVSRVKKVKSLTCRKIKELADDEDFIELCNWCFSLSDFQLSKTLTHKLCSAGGKKAQELLKEKLIDPLIDVSVKSLIVENFILKKYLPPYSVCVDYILKKLNPQIVYPDKETRLCYSAYALAYSQFIMFLPQDAENAANKFLLQIFETVRGNPLIKDKKALAAVIAYRSGKDTDSIKGNIIDLFGADKKLFETYLKLTQEFQAGVIFPEM
jgi:tetratricopeptide (TPR) repeat protein